MEGTRLASRVGASVARTRDWVMCATAGAGLSLAVGLPSLLGQRLLLLDWDVGPHSKIPAAAWGLEGGLGSGLLFTFGILELNRVLGPVTTWAPLLAFFPLGMFTMARLVAGGRVAAIAAGLLYVLNPIVFERAHVGHFAFLTGYALLPMLIRQLLDVSRRAWYWTVPPGVLAGICIGASPHFAWIAAVLVLGTFLARPSKRSAAVLALVGVIVGLLSIYTIVLPPGQHAPVAVGLDDLATYRTAGDATWGLFGNVLGLYGFWRTGPVLPKAMFAGWPFVLLAILLLGVFGLVKGFRSPERRPLARLVAVSAMFGFVLSLGDQGPFGWLYRWAFVHVPLFAVMREPQKFIALLAVSYAVCFGWGVGAAVEALRSPRARRSMVAAACSLPIIYTPTLFVGLPGSLEGTTIPPDWRTADETIGSGDGRVLALPWHQYLSFPYTPGVVANPIDGLLRRDVIAGDNVELARIATSSTSTRSAYLEYLYSQGDRLCAFGSLVSSLGVEFIVLAKTVDFGRYQWLSGQRDLELVLDLPHLSVYRNTSWQLGLGSINPVVVRDWADLAERANRGEDVRVARRPGSDRSRAPVFQRSPRSIKPGCIDESASELEAEASVSVVRRSKVRYDLNSSRRGVVAIPELYDSEWTARAPSRTLELAGGSLGVELEADSAVVEFRHWRVVRLAYLLTAAAFVGLSLTFVLLRKRAERGSDGPSPSDLLV